MRATGILQSLPASDRDCFVDFEMPDPEPTARDLLVRVRAISVNPVDTKVRAGLPGKLESPKVLGWDVAGTVEQAGADVSLFRPGDEVWYAGSITRPGCNSELHLVDERIVGRKPTTLSWQQAAALPLTGITAWEALFDRLAIQPDEHAGRSLLIIGAAGGVGSIAVQLATRVAGLDVIATASRDETVHWCMQMGSRYCINHHHDLAQELERIGVPEVDYILCLNDTDRYFATMAKVIRPQGKICSIVGNREPLNLDLLKNKSATFAWEFMFTRAMYETDDMQQQHRLLERLAGLVDEGVIRTTMTRSAGSLSADTLRAAHAEIESGTMIGKLVLSGYGPDGPDSSA